MTRRGLLAVWSLGLLAACSAPGARDSPALDAARVASPPDAVAAGTRAFEAVLRAFWDPERRLFFTFSDRRAHSHHPFGPDAGRYSDFWWSAHLWELTLDAWERTGDPRHRRLVDDVHDGFAAAHPSWANDFNDDLNWWALACVRAHALTGEPRFLDEARTLFDAVWAFHDRTYGGGVWWKRDGTTPQKGLCVSAPLAMTAARLWRATGDRRYLDAARAEHGFVARRLVRPGGRVDDHVEGPGAGEVVGWQLTYDYGTWIGACLDLHEATGGRAFLDQALAAADHAVAHLAPGGVLQAEGDDDGAGFKMILTRQLARLGRAHDRPDLVRFVGANAAAAWARRRPGDDLTGSDWSRPAPSTPIQSFAAASAAAVQLHALAPRPTRSPPRERPRPDPARRGEAEHGRRRGAIGVEARATGFDGTGYLAGWSAGGRVELDLEVPATGPWALALRYSAGAGDATRALLVDGAPVTSVRFPGTPSWDDWRMLALPRLVLTAGAHTIAIEHDAGSANWLNLDRVVLAPDPAALGASAR